MATNKKDNKTIQMRIYFFTSDLKGKIIPGQCWESGRVTLAASIRHRIKPKKAETFASLLGLPKAIAKVLIKNNATIRPGKITKDIYVPKSLKV